MSIDDTFNSCKTSAEMAFIFNSIKNKKGILASYKQPCDYMKVSVGVTQKVYESGMVLMELLYMDKYYQEFVNGRDFGFESFWSGIGGFVGIFLGYSLLQLPELLDKLWVWCLTKNAVKKTLFSFKRRVQDNKDVSSNPV